MNVAVDLHMHSCLSPCGDENMTPNNLVRMSYLKGLDMIAVCDHNSARQLPAIAKICREIGLALVPGMEITTKEEVHLLGYFRSVEAACAFSEEIYAYLPDIPNRPEYFGRQLVMNEEDEIVAEEPKLLISATDLSLDRLVDMLRATDALPVPAHINRGSNGLLNALGFLPPSLNIASVEIANALPCAGNYDRFTILHSSDAHYLENISEREHFLDMPSADLAGFFALFDR